MSTSDPERPTSAMPVVPTPPEPDEASAPSTDSGRHATARPLPTPPEDLPAAPEPAAAPTTGAPTRVSASQMPRPQVTPPARSAHDAAGTTAVLSPPPTPSRQVPTEDTVATTGVLPPLPTSPATGGSDVPDGRPALSAGPVPSGADRSADDEHLFPAPNAPRTVTVGTHVLGVIVGVLLGPVAAGVALLGQARVLAAQVDAWDASVEVLGITLVTLGLVLLAVVLLLGLWTPAVPITAGGLLTAAGALSLYAPGVVRTQVLDVLSSDGWRLTVTQTLVAGTSGTLLAGGLLLLVGGITVAAARRQGARLGAFRERNRA